jgi:hypothetical protein
MVSLVVQSLLKYPAPPPSNVLYPSTNAAAGILILGSAFVDETAYWQHKSLRVINSNAQRATRSMCKALAGAYPPRPLLVLQCTHRRLAPNLLPWAKLRELV